jgi:hypothetical protein
MTNDLFSARRRKLEDTIRRAARELMALEEANGFSFPFGDGREIRLGIEPKPDILFDTTKGCTVVDGKECYTAQEFWDEAWAAELKSTK